VFNTDRYIVKGHTTCEFEENKEFDEDYKTDRDIAKGHITFNFEENEEDEEVPAWTRNGGDDRDSGEGAAHDDGQNYKPQEVPRPLLRDRCSQEEFQSFAQQWSLYTGCHCEMDATALRHQLLNCTDGPLEAAMYDALGSKIDTVTETKMMEELEKTRRGLPRYDLRGETGQAANSSQ
jgi:hypothetical protein